MGSLSVSFIVSAVAVVDAQTQAFPGHQLKIIFPSI
jgi:hypothetical protein